MKLRIEGGSVLLEDGPAQTGLLLRDGVIAGAGTDLGTTEGRRLDAAGLLVLPGIVDLHGDAFERQIQPRPGNLDALEMALADVGAGRVHMVAFNDHTPSIIRKMDTASGAAKYSERAMMTVDAFRELARAAEARLPEVPDAVARMAAAARAAGLPMASHDDDTVATRHGFRALGAAICEFPMAEDVGIEARNAGEAVVMGAPNVVRGGSHLGWASAATMAERGVCSVLVSDYYYPAMAQAGLILGRGPLGLAQAWKLVSANPAAAAKLHDRGRIAHGLRGDLVLLEPESGAVVATLVEGRVAHMTAQGWSRLDRG